MTIKRIHDDQPKEFKFSSENLKKANEILKKIPWKEKKKRSDAFFIFSAKTKL